MKKPTIHTSRIQSGIASPEEIAWNRYYRNTVKRLGLASYIISSGNSENVRFSSDYKTSAEFYSDMELAAKYLAEHKRVPEELICKLEKAIDESKETN